MAETIPFFTLTNGTEGNKLVYVPSVGIGYVMLEGGWEPMMSSRADFFCRCWMGHPGGDERVENMLKTALKVCSIFSRLRYF